MPIDAPMTPVFATPLDGIVALVDAAHSGGSTTLVVDSGSKFGNPSPSAPVRITGLSLASGARVHYLITGRSGNNLTVATADGYADIDLDVGDKVAVTCNAGVLGDIHEAILANVETLESLVSVVNTASTGFTFDQPTPASTWVIDHGLGRFPSVTVVDSAGTVVIGTVVYNSVDRITLSFSGGFSGSAYLN